MDIGTRDGLPAVLVVFGVSGAGKTTVASMLAGRLQWEFQDGDWFHPAANVEKMHSGQALDDEDRRPWLAAIARWIDETRATGRHGIVACSALKRAYRDVLVGDRPDVRLVFLQGDRELIARRISTRQDHFMPPSLLDSQFRALEPPGPDERPVTVSIDATPSGIVDEILARLTENAT